MNINGYNSNRFKSISKNHYQNPNQNLNQNPKSQRRRNRCRTFNFHRFPNVSFDFRMFPSVSSTQGFTRRNNRIWIHSILCSLDFVHQMVHSRLQPKDSLEETIGSGFTRFCVQLDFMFTSISLTINPSIWFLLLFTRFSSPDLDSLDFVQKYHTKRTLYDVIVIQNENRNRNLSASQHQLAVDFACAHPTSAAISGFFSACCHCV